ncbi:hypothetical protein BHG03_25850 [Klebsiella pneumoniae]|nr:hypothetical protein BHG03_25850 [Klebsiella pneumoniae]
MPTYLFLRRLRRSPAAFSGLTLVILLVLTALFAPWLAPHDPNWQDAAARLQGPGRDTGSAPTATAALLIGVSFVLINNLTDLLVRLTDPRVR